MPVESRCAQRGPSGPAVTPVVAVCAPVYNEGAGIAATASEWRELLKRSGLPFEIVLCDDGSADSTPAVLDGLDLPELTVVRHARNRGAGAALRTAIAHSTAEWLILIDSDGQFALEDGLGMLESLRAGSALTAIGVRRKQDRWLLVMGSKITSWLANRIYHSHVRDFNCALRVVHGDECRRMPLRSVRLNYGMEITAQSILMGLPIIQMPVSHRARTTGQSNARVFRDGMARLKFLRYLHLEAKLVRSGTIDLGCGVTESVAVQRSAPIRAFLFDLDGVLWDSNGLHAEAMERTCAEAGLDMPEYAPLAGLTTPDAFERILAENGNPPALSVEALTARKRSLFRERIHEVTSDDEALQESLRHARPPFLALVTGASSATTDAFLRRMPADYFDLVITGEDGLPSKPAPDVYIAAAQRLGLEPRECVVFEDSRAGLTSAREAGTRVAHITGTASEACDGSCGSDWCAPTISEALEMIRGEQ